MDLKGETLAPRELGEASRMVREAGTAGLKICPAGGGTRSGMGRPPLPDAVRISTVALDRLIRYEPDDLTLSAEAGVRLGDLQRRLRDHGQWLPVNPAKGEQATLGGLLATASSGSLRARFGSWRDLVLGMSVVLAGGEQVKSGGQVVKNVAGYDLHKLHVGALGTLGLIASVNLRVSPLPRDRRLMLLGMSDRREAARLGSAIAASQIEPAAVELVSRRRIEARDSKAGQSGAGCGLDDWLEEHEAVLAVRLAGGSTDCDQGAKWLLGIAGKAKASELRGEELARISSALDDLPGEAATICRIATAPEAAARIAADGQAPESNWSVTDLSSGVVHQGWRSDADPVAIASHVESLRGELGRTASVVLLAATAEVRDRVDVWGPRPPGYALMQSVKQALDPDGVWNPGRFVGEI